MFEDALMESGGKITTHRTWFSGVAAICNRSIACLLALWPLLHPASLPRQALSTLLAAPSPPAQPLPHMNHVVSVARASAFANPFTPPKIISNSIATDREPLPVDSGLAPLARDGGSWIGLPDSIGNAAPPQVHVAPLRRLVISSGVMAGNKLSGAEPRYPNDCDCSARAGHGCACSDHIENRHDRESPRGKRAPYAGDGGRAGGANVALSALSAERRAGGGGDNGARPLSPRRVAPHLLASAKVRADSSSLLTDSFETDSE
jgi:hypothetical protein